MHRSAARGVPRLVAAITLAASAVVASAQCRIESPAHRVALLELYTSEGCNSCPPADRWLAAQKFDASRVVALAFHVDYWNQLGWEDRFSHADYSARQREIAQRNGGRFVYTPQFVLDGRDWQQWRAAGALGEALSKLSREQSGAAISITATREGSTAVVEGSVTMREDGAGAVWLALYEDDLQTVVRAGENRGRTLEHDRVVRILLGPIRAQARTAIKVRERLALRPEWRAEHLGLAVFAQDTRTGSTLQAVAVSGCL
jgi:hypothetical protein